MKESLIVFAMLVSWSLLNVCTAQNNTGIGTAQPDSTAILDVNSNDKGFLLPRLTTAERNSITDPAQSL